MIKMIIIILDHGADDNIHMAMQGATQSGFHEGNYEAIETADWPANWQVQAFHWLVGKSTTVVSVPIAKDMPCCTRTVHFHRWQNWQRR